MATFAYRIRTTKKSTLTKVYLRFNVDRHTSFYAESQYVVWADAWDNKKQAVKSRYAFTDDFTEQQGRELMKNLSELRSFILGEMAKDRLQLPPSTQRIRRPQYTQQRIIDRLYSPLYARNGGRHKAQYPQAALRGVDNQEL